MASKPDMLKRYFVLVLIILNTVILYAQKEYVRQYFSTDQIESEGWVENGEKTGYWKFYYKTGELREKGNFTRNKPNGYWYYFSDNGTIVKEGHIINGKSCNWWIFYTTNGEVNYKCQMNDGLLDGYFLDYYNGELVSASKYTKGKLIKEWDDYKSFTRENDLNDLR